MSDNRILQITAMYVWQVFCTDKLLSELIKSRFLGENTGQSSSHINEGFEEESLPQDGK